jgi:hypothetical protein
MELEVEEDKISLGEDRLKYSRAPRDEQFQAYLEPRACTLEAVDEIEGGGCITHIQGNDQAFAGGFERISFAG